LEAGLNIEATNILGETPLHYAAKFGKVIAFSSCCVRESGIALMNEFSLICQPYQKEFLKLPFSLLYVHDVWI
jgi:ankyrin repeat protein